ncbi:MAG: ferrous iron transport protein A [Clostridia bacterium]|nr:ferrous iron transport protein A [Clostridia bacterium]
MRPGDTAIIYSAAKGELCQRLCDLGFVSGTLVECAAAAPMSGPLAYLIRGALIALRRNDAKNVKIGFVTRGGKEVWD